MSEKNLIQQFLDGIGGVIDNHYLSYRGKTYKLDDPELPAGASVQFLRDQLKALAQEVKEAKE